MIPLEKIKTIEKYCNKIYANGRQQHIKDMVFDPHRTGKEVNLQGLGAEIWFKEKHNIPYTLFEDKENFVPRSYKKDIDCMMEGIQLEIKQTSYPTGCLFLNEIDHYGKKRKMMSEMFVLIVGSFPDYSHELYLSKKELLDRFPEPTYHNRIRKRGYHSEQDKMYQTFKEANKYNGNTGTSSSTMP